MTEDVYSSYSLSKLKEWLELLAVQIQRATFAKNQREISTLLARKAIIEAEIAKRG